MREEVHEVATVVPLTVVTHCPVWQRRVVDKTCESPTAVGLSWCERVQLDSFPDPDQGVCFQEGKLEVRAG